MQNHIYNAIGLMSGTSLDGLDIAFCRFELLQDQKWDWEVLNCMTRTYPVELKSKLSKSKELSGLELHLLDLELGKWMGEVGKEFIKDHKLKVDFIASHGHTVFHMPENQLSLQIGNPNFIHAFAECPVISDFRTLDMARGGQGAPLVPIGDALLFPNYDFCINLGGIANVSYADQNNKRLAYDICACNILLNSLAKLKGFEYDEHGLLAKSGKEIPELLKEWNNFHYLNKTPPKSLGIEMIEPEILSKIDESRYSAGDMLKTAVSHIATQICNAVVSAKKGGKILLTGGGALNSYLVEKIESKLSKNYEIVVAERKIVDFKEALIFAFLGVLNVRNEWNTWASVTGAHANSVSGQKLGNI
ncbi:anhydro-N-acetylmuramic acid kinase [Marivirga sericea]|uniref:Anhydro-N-acetylmuramic acid kinase n=1 Tax=Marivirga sericea TaxID=1028 RepID=A0A1X7KP24_9BACT|nr:anhydro-N-acetylmuramic acid kinase [Marivirga sericea]SMG43279.1 anhydro-N-acetylmuramic acid kinase [Marivirga sericea]